MIPLLKSIKRDIAALKPSFFVVVFFFFLARNHILAKRRLKQSEENLANQERITIETLLLRSQVC